MLSQRLRNSRKAKKLTQEQLAHKVQTKKTTISNYETGYSTPSNEMLKDLANTLDVSVDYLLGRTDDTNNNVLMDPIISLLNDPSLSEEDRDIIERIRDLPPSKKHLVKELLKAFEAETNK
ncbi:helix-turn-helix domain-containing protein [Brevibacillus laterosporus]|uniref:helix-turn-helix domain-containing protein n=1 Tax=Brevibacillus laterosporus TaxID=1465 RepID=UPI003D199FA9